VNNDLNIYYGLAQGKQSPMGMTAPAVGRMKATPSMAGMGGMSRLDLMELIRKMQQQKLMNQEMQTAMGLLNMAGPSVGAPAQMNMGSLLSMFGSK